MIDPGSPHPPKSTPETKSNGPDTPTGSASSGGSSTTEMPSIQQEALRFGRAASRTALALAGWTQTNLSRAEVRWYLMLLLALVSLTVTWVRSSDQDVLLDLSTKRFAFRSEAPGSDRRLEFGLSNLPLHSVVIQGARLSNPWVGSGASAAGIEAGSEDESEDGATYAVRPSPQASGSTVGSIQSIAFPVGSEVELSTNEVGLIVVIRTPRSGDRSITVDLAVDKGGRLELEGHGRLLREVRDRPESIGFVGTDAGVVTIFARLPETPDARARLGVYGFRTTSIDVLAPLAMDQLRADSLLLRGFLSFPELPRREREQLWMGERVMGERFDGRIMQIEYRAASSEQGSEMEPHLHVVWRGSIEELRIGHAGGLRDARPTLLESWVGGRGVADYFAIATALLAFVSLLLPRSEREAENAEKAGQKARALRGRNSDEEN